MDSETEAEELFGDEQPASSKGKTNLQSSLPDTRELDTELGRMPQDLRIALERQVSMVLDCVLDTLEHAPDEMTLPTGPEVVSTITGMPTLDPEKSETQEDPTVDAPGAYSFQPSASGKVYSVILWNDEKHSFKEVIDQVTDATGVSEAHAKGVAERVDKHVSPFARRVYRCFPGRAEQSLHGCS